MSTIRFLMALRRWTGMAAVIGIAWATHAPAWAEAVTDNASSIPSAVHAARDVEHKRIAVQRQQIEAAQADALAECLRRFAVNSCQQDVRARFREPLADLRRQEWSLNDAERREKGAAQRALVDQRLREQQQQQEQRALEPQNGETIRPNSEEQSLQRGQAASERVREQKAREAQQRDAAASRAQKAAGSSAERSAYEEKQRQAQEHREQNARDQADRTKPPAKPLPAPP